MAFHFTGPDTVALDKLPEGGNAMTLDPVAVEGRTMAPPQAEIDNLPPAFAGGQVARGSKVGILGNRDMMDTPFSTASYTSELIKNQEARTVADVLENDPSVRFSTPGGHVQEQFTIRGLDSSAADMALNGMYGLLPKGHTPTEFLERVELIKGPNALLTGLSPQGSVGGLISVTTKRAQDTPTNNVTVDYTSDSQVGTHVDFGRRFGTDGRVGVRVNGVYRDGETGVEGEKKENNLGAIALDYRGQDVRLSLDAYSNRDEFEGGQPFDIQMAANARSIPSAPDSDTNLFPGAHGQQESNAVLLRGEYDILRNLTAYAAVGALKFRQAGYNITSTHAQSAQANGNYNALSVSQRDDMNSLSSEFGVKGNFVTGPVKHQTVLSYSLLSQDLGTNSVRSDPAVPSNIYAPVPPLVAPLAGPIYTSERSDLSSLALADTLSILDERVQLTVGARHQTVESKYYNATGAQTSEYDKDIITPAAGLVVKPVEQVSLFGNYIEGLTKGTQVTANNAVNRFAVFSPYVSKQIETGVKWDGGNVGSTLSLFQIKKRSLSNAEVAPNSYLYTQAEQRNRGIEWSTFGSVTDQLRVLGGLVYLTSEYTKHANAAYVGNEAYGVPHWQGNLGLEWDTPMVSGLTLEGRAVYTGEQYANSANTLTIPEWWRFDIGARYATPVYGTDVTFRGYVTNLFDANYWVGSFSDNMVNLSEGRTFMLSTTVGF
ncbi:MAG: TonB-dependent siderophore receptor [Magnetospirillum sp.]|nr:TonB-dependent siderophore receptor [Magnetospirillum sp.]